MADTVCGELFNISSAAHSCEHTECVGLDEGPPRLGQELLVDPEVQSVERVDGERVNAHSNFWVQKGIPVFRPSLPLRSPEQHPRWEVHDVVKAGDVRQEVRRFQPVSFQQPQVGEVAGQGPAGGSILQSIS